MTAPYSYKIINVEAEYKYPESLLNKMRDLINLRKSNPIFAVGTYEFLAKDQPSCLVILRSHQGENMIAINNLKL